MNFSKTSSKDHMGVYLTKTQYKYNNDKIIQTAGGLPISSATGNNITGQKRSLN